MDNSFGNAVFLIKDAIIRSRYQAATLVNRELLGLYYAVGKYVSDNSRNSVWGKGTIKQISNDLQKELPGLRGFSESAIKHMREFYEQWVAVFSNSPLSVGDLKEDIQNGNRPLSMGDLDEDHNTKNRPLPTELMSKSFLSTSYFLIENYVALSLWS